MWSDGGRDRCVATGLRAETAEPMGIWFDGGRTAVSAFPDPQGTAPALHRNLTDWCERTF